AATPPRTPPRSPPRPVRPSAAPPRRSDAAARVPAPTLGVLVEGHVRAPMVEVHRRPHPEELRGQPGYPPLRLPDRPHAPGAIARAGCPIREDRQLLVAEADVALPE